MYELLIIVVVLLILFFLWFYWVCIRLKTILDRIWDLDRKITQVAYLTGDIKKKLNIDE